MNHTRRYPIVCAVLFLLLVLGGCDGVKGEATFTFGADGSLTQEIAVDGISLSEEDATSLEGDGWTIAEESAGFSATRDCASVSEFSEGQSGLVRVVSNAADRSTGDADTKIEFTTTNYFFVQRHDVNVSLPELDLAPDECSTCSGEGATDCEDCNGYGWEVCSDCGGSGIESGYYFTYDCWSCDGLGEVECWNCDGSGSVYCWECEGTGEPNPDDMARYESALDDSSLLVTVNMPGVVFEDREDLQWEFEGDDLTDLGKLSASSYMIQWLPTGIAAGVLLVLLVAIVWLVVRSVKATLANARVRSEARRAEKAAVAPVVAPAAPPAAAAPVSASKFCRSCGAAMNLTSQFCPACGVATGTDPTRNEDS